MFVRNADNTLSYLETLPPGVEANGKSLTDGRELAGIGPLDVDTLRRAYSVEECVGRQKKMSLVAYCKFAIDVAKAEGKPAPRILAFVDDDEKACGVALLLQTCGIRSLPLINEGSLQDRSTIVNHSFSQLSLNVLVCADVAIADVQVPGVDHVIHVDLPSKENFVNFGVRSNLVRQTDVANGGEDGGHVHVLFEVGQNEDVAQMLAGYINEHQVDTLPLPPAE